MAVSTNVAICIAVSLCASAAVYFLLRARMSVLEANVDMLCNAVKASATQSRSVRLNPLAPASAVATGARAVNTIVSCGGIPLLTGSSLMPVSDDDECSEGSTSEYTSDEDNDDQAWVGGTVQPNANGSTKTIHYKDDLGVVELSGLIAQMVPAQALPYQNSTIADVVKIKSEPDNHPSEVAVLVSHVVIPTKVESNNDASEGSSEGSSDNEENDDASEGFSNDEETNNDDLTNEVSSALAGIDLSKMGVKELRSLVSQHKLASNPTKLRKPELLNMLSAAKE